MIYIYINILKVWDFKFSLLSLVFSSESPLPNETYIFTSTILQTFIDIYINILKVWDFKFSLLSLVFSSESPLPNETTILQTFIVV